MRLFDRFFHQRAKAVVDRVCVERLPAISQRIARDVIADLWKTDPLFRFIKWTQERLQDADKRMSDERAFKLSKRIINQHLRDERIEFGDPRYSWDRDGARSIAEAYEIDHWESPPV